jgi:hypoxanthine phosphoribosyltransferase
MQVLVTAEEVQASVTRLAGEIEKREGRKPLTVIAVMTGSIIFLADLVRKLEMPLRVGVLQVRSYCGTERGALAINSEMLPPIEDRDLLILDDIFDTGHTLLRVSSLLRELRPRSLRTAVLVLKRGKQLVNLKPDYVGLEIPDVFVVGYGLDYNDAYRNLPYLASLEPSDISPDSTLPHVESRER